MLFLVLGKAVADGPASLLPRTLRGPEQTVRDFFHALDRGDTVTAIKLTCSDIMVLPGEAILPRGFIDRQHYQRLNGGSDPIVQADIRMIIDQDPWVTGRLDLSFELQMGKKFGEWCIEEASFLSAVENLAEGMGVAVPPWLYQRLTP